MPPADAQPSSPPPVGPFAAVPHPDELVGLLADEARLAVVAALVAGPASLATYVLDPSVFARSVRAAASLRPKEATPDEWHQLRRFFQRGRLVAVPGTADAAFPLVLAVVVESFPFGEDFDEPEVTRRLLAWHPDHASLRRYLVDAGLLHRGDGRYWRNPADEPGAAEA